MMKDRIRPYRHALFAGALLSLGIARSANGTIVASMYDVPDVNNVINDSITNTLGAWGSPAYSSDYDGSTGVGSYGFTFSTPYLVTNETIVFCPESSPDYYQMVATIVGTLALPTPNLHFNDTVPVTISEPDESLTGSFGIVWLRSTLERAGGNFSVSDGGVVNMGFTMDVEPDQSFTATFTVNALVAPDSMDETFVYAVPEPSFLWLLPAAGCLLRWRK